MELHHRGKIARKAFDELFLSFHHGHDRHVVSSYDNASVDGLFSCHTLGPGSLECADGSRSSINKWTKITSTNSWRWCLGLIYIVAVAGIWIAASYIVQSVVDAGVSPFLITYICNSLFVVYIPIVEAARYFEDSVGNFWTKLKFKDAESLQQASDLESVNLLQSGGHEINVASDQSQTRPSEDTSVPDTSFPASKGLDAKGRWTRARVAKVSMLISPFWFLAQLTFNLSLRYTTVTSNTILSSTSSLFTFLVALVFLGETFTWLKLISVLLCMGGLIDNVLSDYLWGKAILLTTTTVATAGLTIQVPIAAIVDTLTGHAPHLLDYIGAAAVLVGFAGINIPVGESPQVVQQEQETPIVSMVDDRFICPAVPMAMVT
ncbi:unnamed protein product [Miscanthus lutarioriparius]|uniref:EamA domain-containing protein n=1 Tax=Miscanthus lutarioriparius TaxID=422564 RepID=A0A811SDI6_9POAL|nr:unnamed protein product [Miscanthus lutarioriparius]